MRADLYKNSIIFGLAAAAACFSYICLLWQLDFNPFGRHKYLYSGIYAIFFVWGMRRFRVKHNNDQLSSVQGLSTGLLLNLVATVTYGLLLLLLMSTVGSGLIERHRAALDGLQLANIDYMKGQMEESLKLEDKEAYENLGEQLTTMEAMYQNFLNSELSAADLALDQASGLFMLGIFLTFLFMLILRSKSEAGNDTKVPKKPKLKR